MSSSAAPALSRRVLIKCALRGRKSLGKELGRKGKGLFMPLRLAFTGDRHVLRTLKGLYTRVRSSECVGTTAGPDVPAQLELTALAATEATIPFVPLNERLAILEKAVATLPEPAAAA